MIVCKSVSGTGFEILFKRKLLYNRFLANALPEAVLRYFSKSRAFSSSVKAMAVLVFHGMYFEGCLHFF
jgi:hypothetical protein